jgi:hypothetical protein
VLGQTTFAPLQPVLWEDITLVTFAISVMIVMMISNLPAKMFQKVVCPEVNTDLALTFMIESGDVMKLIDKHVKENPVIIFMKGTPSQPQCGFSAQSIRILNAIGVEFASVNVLDYPSIREGIKAYS